MAMEAPDPSLLALRIDDLQRENEHLREQIRQLAAQATVAKGAIREAVHEKEATVRIAHQVAAEERATRAAVEVQGHNLGFNLVLNILNFFLLLVLTLGLFLWVPREIASRVRPTVVTPPGAVVTPP